MTVSAADFADRVWSREPLLTRAAQLPQGCFTDLLSPGDVDELVADRALREPFFRLVKDGGGLPSATRTATAGARRISDLADPQKIAAQHLDGATLVLQSLHRLHPPVVRFCRSLAAELGHATQCNAYVTPAGDAQGFDFHHDTHDVFVLQVSGRKRWTIHEPVLRLPLPSQPRAGDGLVADGAEPLMDVILEPGDCLYLPRGFVHAASTTDQHSVHLTIGVLSTTWYDVLQDLLSLASSSEAFRDALPTPPVSALEDLPAFLTSVADWVGTVPVEELRSRVAIRLAGAVPPEPVRMLAQAEALRTLTATTKVRPRAGLRWSLDRAPSTVLLQLPDRVVSLPAVVEPAVRQLLTGPSTAVGIAAQSANLDEDDCQVLLRRMLREGAVVPA